MFDKNPKLLKYTIHYYLYYTSLHVIFTLH